MVFNFFGYLPTISLTPSILGLELKIGDILDACSVV